MGVSKVELGDNTLVDLTQDTVTPEVLQKGYTAHGADGEPIIGTEEAVLLWKNTENGSYKFVQNGDRWIANNRGTNSSSATSTWTVTVPEAITAYIGYRTSTETLDRLSITLNGNTILYATGGIIASEVVLTLNLVEGENKITAIYTKDSSAHQYGDMAYVILPLIGEQPGQYKYQSKSVTPTNSSQTVYPDTGYDGLYAVTVGAQTSSNAQAKSGSLNVTSGSEYNLNLGFVPDIIVLNYQNANNRYEVYNGRIGKELRYSGSSGVIVASPGSGVFRAIASTVTVHAFITDTMYWYAAKF